MIEGNISVDVSFREGTAVDGGKSLKTITLRDAQEYTSGKVAIVTGTAGTTAVTVSTLSGLGYRDASGQLVTFSSIRRVVFGWDGTSDATATDTADNAFLLRASTDSPAASNVGQLPGVQVDIASMSPGVTGSYTIVIYGT